MLDIVFPHPMAIVVAAFAIAVIAGVIKGAVGFAMPLVMVSGFSSIMDPKVGLAILIVPVVISNVMQTFRNGVAPAWDAIIEFRRYLLIVCIAIIVAAQAVNYVSDQAFYAVLGVPVVALSVLQLLGWRMQIKPENRNKTEWGVGLLSGILGGLAGTWGPTTVLYLIAIDTPKVKQMVVQGVIYGLGAIALLLGHIQSGIFNRDTAPFSAVLLVPAVIGMWIGFRIQDRMNQELFRRATLVVLVVAGLNLIRKALI